jgi:hypothetical protein
MNRDKEKALSDLIRQYEESGAVKKRNNPGFLKSVAQVITGTFAPKVAPR